MVAWVPCHTDNDWLLPRTRSISGLAVDDIVHTSASNKPTTQKSLLKMTDLISFCYNFAPSIEKLLSALQFLASLVNMGVGR